MELKIQRTTAPAQKPSDPRTMGFGTIFTEAVIWFRKIRIFP